MFYSHTHTDLACEGLFYNGVTLLKAIAIVPELKGQWQYGYEHMAVALGEHFILTGVRACTIIPANLWCLDCFIIGAPIAFRSVGVLSFE